MNILITGATGAIGKKLIQKLSEIEKYRLVLLMRHKNRKAVQNSSLQIRIGDLLDLESLKMATENIDVVLHLASITHSHKEKKYYDVNLIGTKNLVIASEFNNVSKFVFISSRAASLNGGAYAKSKYLAQQEVEKYKYKWAILSPAEVYGASSEEAISKLIHSIKKYPFVLIPGRGNYELSPIFIDDVIRVIINSIEAPEDRKTYILAGPKSYPYNEIVDLIALLNKKKIKKIYVPLWMLKIAAPIFPNIVTKDQIPRLVTKKESDISLAKKDLAFNPIEFGCGLRKMY